MPLFALRSRRTCSLVSLITLALMGDAYAAQPAFHFTQDFDSLAPGTLATFPGSSNQGGYYGAGPGFDQSDIQSAIAISGNALRQIAPASAGNAEQSYAVKDLPHLSLADYGIVTLAADFYASSDRLDLTNPYIGTLRVVENSDGSPTVAGFTIFGGNGQTKASTGVNVGLGKFNGVDNDEGISLTVGQHLGWDTWHHVSLTVDHYDDTLVSITVDGQTQSLLGTLPERAFPGGVPTLPDFIDGIQHAIIVNKFPGEQSTDTLVWDNAQIVAVPEPVCGIIAFAPVLLSARRRRV